jgi:hypothetical protein
LKTQQLIGALTQDVQREPGPGRALLMAMLPACGVAILAFIVLAGLREDLLQAAQTVRFGLKIAVNLLLWGIATGLILRMASPGAPSVGWQRALVAVPVLLALAVGLELWLLPRAQWADAAVGENSRWCLTMIPLLGAGPLVAALWMLRRSAATRPTAAGAVAGLFAGGLAGALYGLHCTDDSPLFLATWYSLATLALAGIGAALGRRLLRW